MPNNKDLITYIVISFFNLLVINTLLVFSNNTFIIFDISSDEDSNQERKNKVMKAMHELPDGYRTVFNLYSVEGYSHKEIADILDISENTSKSQLSKARKYLRSLLGVQEPQKKKHKEWIKEDLTIS